VTVMNMKRVCLGSLVAVAAFSTEPRASGAGRSGGLDRAEKADPSQNDERDPVEASVDATQLGVVTWVDARVEIPIVSGLSVFPQGALLHLAPQGAVNDEEWHGYAGAGLGWGPADRWHLEISTLYGPPDDDIESLAGELEVEWELGGDDASEAPRPLELHGGFSVQHVRWENGAGPAGSDIVQFFGDLSAVWRPRDRLEVRPRCMLFAYDKSLDRATNGRFGGIAVLAEVGTYAPLALGGLAVGYSFLRWLTPSVSVREIAYAAGVGDATEVSLGARVRITRGWTVSASGGFLWNRVHGPLVQPDSPSWLPVGELEIAATF
jgi:hypothetical protein